ncbi:MAG: respiratory nitrate reductase subunit gamma [Alphaproteobacteria bacterium]|nr:respiratory nitrate reductase subunit gamma [Alphaproteobacteria bacterium]MDE2111964.1 respiratory nitrate reductase subunit gamma [Alphaproteobacteria bacterium]MDE2492528.1 respiratory nitrate reductase subunit gamma [Alphaproteobacteria bacterium]
MTHWINTALFGIYPYVCLTVLLIGSVARFDGNQYSWRSQSSQLLRRRQLIWGSNLFHVGILVIFVGHFGGLLTPVAVWDWLGVSHTFKQITAMMVGGTAGLFCLVGLVMLLHRRLTDPRILKTSSFGDIAILFLLLAQLLLGLSSIFVSAHHLDGSKMVLLMNWAQHVVTFRPGAADFVAPVSIIFKCHLVLGMTIFLVFPFTRLVHVWSAPIWYLGRRGYQIVRTKRLGA